MPNASQINASDARGADYSAATMVPSELAMTALTDEECIRRLADAIESKDEMKFEEVAMLIGRLAVTIE